MKIKGSVIKFQWENVFWTKKVFIDHYPVTKHYNVFANCLDILQRWKKL